MSDSLIAPPAGGPSAGVEAFRQLLEAHPRLFADGPVVLHLAGSAPDHAVGWVSSNIEKVTGYQAAALTSDRRFWTSRLHPEDRLRVLAALSRLGRDETTALEYRFLVGDGSYRWFLHQVGLVDDREEGRHYIGMLVDVDARRRAEADAVTSTVIDRSTWPMPANGEEKRLFVTQTSIEPDLVMSHVLDMTSHRRTEEALRHSVETLSAIFRASPVAIIAIDRNGLVEAWNPTAERIFGWSADEVVGRPLPFVPDGERRSSRSLIDRLVGGETVRDLPLRRQRRDGSPIDIRISAAPVRGANGEVTGIVSVGEDVTERLRSDEALRQRERQQATIAALGQHALRGIDLQGLFEMACDLVTECLGTEYCKVIELRPNRDLVIRAVSGWSPELLGKTVDHGLEEPQARFALANEAPLLAADLFSAAPFRRSRLMDAYGVASGMSVVIHGRDVAFGVLQAESMAVGSFAEQDLSFLQAIANVLAAAIDRKRSEEELAEKEARLRMSVEQMPAILFSVDRSLRFTSSLGSGLADVGARPDDFVGVTLGDVIGDSETEEIVVSAHNRAFAGESASYEVDWRSRTYSVHIEPFRNLEGEITGAIGLATDVSNRKESERQLHTSRERLRALSARMLTIQEDERTRIAREVHDELGQALTALHFDLKWMQRHASDPAVLARIAEMQKVTDGTIETVRRIARELRPPLLEHLGLLPAVRSEVDEFRKRTQIDVDLSVGPVAVPSSEASATAVLRILQEALTNVARHAEATRVDIRLEPAGWDLVLTVRDDGKGFDPAGVTKKYSLGLVGMSERARAAGGTVEVESLPGRGTSIVLRMPAVPEKRETGNDPDPDR